MEMSVSIRNPKNVYKPGDLLEGEITIWNPDKDRKGNPKPAKLKFVQMTFAEHVRVAENQQGLFTVYLEGTREMFKGKMLGKEIDLPEWKGEEFKDNTPITKFFNVKVPGGWHNNLGGQLPSKDWYVICCIREKTGMIGEPKFTRIFPVLNSDQASTLFDTNSKTGPAIPPKSTGKKSATSATTPNPIPQEIYSTSPQIGNEQAGIDQLIAQGNNFITTNMLEDGLLSFQHALSVASNSGNTQHVQILDDKIKEIRGSILLLSQPEMLDSRWTKFENILRRYSEISIDKFGTLLGFESDNPLAGEEWLVSIPLELPLKIVGSIIKVDSANVPLQLPSLRVKYWQFNHPQETLIDEEEVLNMNEHESSEIPETETQNLENQVEDDVKEDAVEIITKPAEMIPACFFCGEPVRDGLCTFCAAWVCPECGTLNHSIATQCSKCLKFREKKTA